MFSARPAQLVVRSLTSGHLGSLHTTLSTVLLRTYRTTQQCTHGREAWDSRVNCSQARAATRDRASACGHVSAERSRFTEESHA